MLQKHTYELSTSPSHPLEELMEKLNKFNSFYRLSNTPLVSIRRSEHIRWSYLLPIP